MYSRKLQNRVIRSITDSPYDAPAKPLLRRLRLPSIAEVIRQESASMVYKAINGWGSIVVRAHASRAEGLRFESDSMP